jgi:hypothetical protein
MNFINVNSEIVVNFNNSVAKIKNYADHNLKIDDFRRKKYSDYISQVDNNSSNFFFLFV